jgi:hypothetical protein
MASTAVTRVPAALADGLFEVGDAPVGDRELVLALGERWNEKFRLGKIFCRDRSPARITGTRD